MKSHFQVELSESGLPQALIPNEQMWELVEYLAFQRTQVTYSYRAEHFIVSFPSMDIEAAQEMLDDWALCSARY